MLYVQWSNEYKLNVTKQNDVVNTHYIIYLKWRQWYNTYIVSLIYDRSEYAHRRLEPINEKCRESCARACLSRSSTYTSKKPKQLIHLQGNYFYMRIVLHYWFYILLLGSKWLMHLFIPLSFVNYNDLLLWLLISIFFCFRNIYRNYSTILYWYALYPYVVFLYRDKCCFLW